MSLFQRCSSVASALKGLALITAASLALAQDAKQPNIVVIMADDQDYQLGSLEAQPTVRQELMAKGLTLENHFVTVAQCCPSRTSFLRGQAAHNTNLTHVAPPGGAYDKFVASGEDKDYLPHWLKAAGYKTEYIGKFMNGLNMGTYFYPPKGWDRSDVLLQPYIYEFNNVVTSIDGETPIFYNGYHQTDVIRAKALERIEHLSEGSEPFYIQIAPAAPHTSGDGPCVPLARHMWSFNNATAPRRPNFNPPDEYQSKKPSFLKTVPLLTDEEVNFVDWSHRSRLQALMGVDEIVEDVLKLLEDKDILDNTYIVYTSDNGYHEGNHRRIGGKGHPYVEDTNVPMIIRGPGVPAGASSNIASTHIDMAPTFLDMAGVSPNEFPVFLDGRSLLPEWTEKSESDGSWNGSYVAKEVLNIEFWGSIDNGAKPDYGLRQDNNSYKSIRLVSENNSWLFSRWCTNNDTELYNTRDDPYELTNLAVDPTPETSKLIGRLNGLLLVTKSCNGNSCRNPWQVLSKEADASFSTLDEALQPEHDDFFSSLPSVGFQQCMDIQYTPNEGPYYPSEAEVLGRNYRESTDNFVSYDADAKRVPGNSGRMGSTKQRHHNMTRIMEKARNVTKEEIGERLTCTAPDWCAPFE